MEMKATCSELLDSSPTFLIEDGPARAPSQSLALFESIALPGPTTGTLAFVGGPTMALDWHPGGRYLALAASRAAQPFHRALYSYSGAAHVQVWAAEVNISAAGGAATQACELSPPVLTLVALLPHDGDMAWDVRWRPAGGDALAACLADGSLVLYEFARGPDGGTTDAVPLRINARADDGARTVAWRADGALLAAGTARGCVEIYAVRERAARAQLLTRVRAHEFIVARVAWLSVHALASVGHDGTLRVRDVREPTIDAETLSDGLAWNTCLTQLEPTVAVAGTDNGFIKAAHLSSLVPPSARASPSQFRRKRVQTGSLRDLVSMPLARTTALFIAGAEGTLFQGSLPRPLYRPPPPGTQATATGARRPPCSIGRYFQVPILQWASARKPFEDSGGAENGGVQKRIMKDCKRSDASMKSVGCEKNCCDEKSEVEYQLRTGPLVLRLAKTLRSTATEKMLTSTTSKVKIHVRTDINLCAEDYEQRAVITRVALTTTSNLIAIGSHAGLLTVLKLSDEMLCGFKPAFKPSKSKQKSKVPAAVSPKRTTTEANKIAKITKQKPPKIPKLPKPTKLSRLRKPPKAISLEEVAEHDTQLKKKRGRPRKYPRPLAVWAAASVIDEIVTKVLGDPYDESALLVPLRAGKPVRRRSDVHKAIESEKNVSKKDATEKDAPRKSKRLRPCKIPAVRVTNSEASVPLRLRIRLRASKEEQEEALCLPLCTSDSNISVPLRLPLRKKGCKPSLPLRLPLRVSGIKQTRNGVTTRGRRTISKERSKSGHNRKR